MWFRSQQRTGDVSDHGATLLVLNHPNGLLDALVATALLDRTPRFLGKATLWRVLVLKPLLAVFDPIPVHRRDDGDVGPTATAKTFAAVHDALDAGDVVAIFPEGISHGRRELAPLKTGAARMVLSARVPVRLVPVGLVYGERETFRHSVLVRVGSPIAYDDLREGGVLPANVAALTDRIRDALVPLTLHGPDDEAQRLAEQLAWLLAEGPREDVQLEPLRARTRMLADELRALPDTTRADIERRVVHATQTLADAGVRPDQLGFAYTTDTVARWLPGFVARLLLAPLIIAFGLLYWPAYRMIGFVIGRLSLDLDVQATYKFLAGLVIGPVWLVATLVAGAMLWGAAGLGLAVVAAVAAFVALPLVERLRDDVAAIRGFARRRDARLADLGRERDALVEAFPELRRWIAVGTPRADDATSG